MSEMKIRAIGIPWYRREDYPRIRKLFKDGNKLPITFDRWLKLAQKAQQALEADGGIVIKAHIDPATFPA